MELNDFADLTADEFRAQHLGFNKPGRLFDRPKNYVELDTTNLASSVDWVSRGAVTPVKNQGRCGSCWAFSTVGAVEGAMYLKTGELQSYSEQQLVDCSTANHGCHGGLMDYGFQYVKSHPLMLESEYPYRGMDGTCRATTGSGQVTGYVDVPPTAESLKAALNRQPVSVAIEADQSSFQLYKTGVITSGCGTHLDHGVLAVGYDGNAIKVKNSWGAAWGDNGYVQVDASQCGITMSASYPTE